MKKREKFSPGDVVRISVPTWPRIEGAILYVQKVSDHCCGTLFDNADMEEWAMKKWEGSSVFPGDGLFYIHEDYLKLVMHDFPISNDVSSDVFDSMF